MKIVLYKYQINYVGKTLIWWVAIMLLIEANAHGWKVTSHIKKSQDSKCLSYPSLCPTVYVEKFSGFWKCLFIARDSIKLCLQEPTLWNRLWIFSQSVHKQIQGYNCFSVNRFAVCSYRPVHTVFSCCELSEDVPRDSSYQHIQSHSSQINSCCGNEKWSKE